jgi:cell fate regulator YaaT (PSP1 superfamily)
MEIVLARYKNKGKILTFNAEGIKFKKGDICVVGFEDEQTYIVILTPNLLYENNSREFLRIIRKATEEDLDMIKKIEENEQIAYDICIKRIQTRELPMKLVCVDFNFDMSKAKFSFTADGRVDFRQLVKDLAYEFRVRIEMKQIGVRDEARIKGELGFCGKELCCRTFLCDFEPVSMRMAKEQNLPLNPTKISGVCGRLFCCLNYENSVYEDIRREMPKIKDRIVLPQGEGTIIEIDLLKEKVKVELDNGNRVILTKSQLNVSK